MHGSVIAISNVGAVRHLAFDMQKWILTILRRAEMSLFQHNRATHGSVTGDLAISPGVRVNL